MPCTRRGKIAPVSQQVLQQSVRVCEVRLIVIGSLVWPRSVIAINASHVMVVVLRFPVGALAAADGTEVRRDVH
jgi:hypothetical protein